MPNRLDIKNGNMYWRDVIKKEMSNVLVAFNLTGHDEDPPRNLKELGIHLIFEDGHDADS